MLAKRRGSHIEIPGLASAHSHAFQRALRSQCQRQSASAGSFWSWRGYMYALAGQLDPETMYQVARFAYAELAMAGVTAVGEFHYLHHQAGGQPYDTRTALADALIEAAQDVGIRICLLRVIYERAGFQQALQAGQERFCDSSLDLALLDLESLRTRYQDREGVQIGLALHSVRAVRRESIRQASQVANAAGMPVHMHLSEQARELEECVAEHGMTPVALMAHDGHLNERFVAVHATHIDDAEALALGHARAFVCVCRTTERDLGDGHCDASRLLRSGARLCTGVDSYAISDPFEEARAIELDQRTRDQKRTVVAEASTLLEAASAEGYAAIGMAGQQDHDRVLLRADDAALIGASEDRLDDAVVFAASPRAVDRVEVAGQLIVSDGVHREYQQICQGFEAALSKLRQAAGL